MWRASRRSRSEPATRGPSHLKRGARRSAFAAIATLSCTACAIDNHGAVLGRITHADGAVVADIYAIGFHLKTKPGDSGLVLGYSRSSYVFAETAEQSTIAEGWHAFSVPVPDAAAKAMHLESVGASAHGNHSNIGMTLGYRAFTLMALVPAEANQVLSVRYQPSRPEETRVRFCGEDSKCAGLLQR